MALGNDGMQKPTVKRFLVVQNLKIAESSVFIFSKLFARHSSRENDRMKESNEVVNIHSVR